MDFLCFISMFVIIYRNDNIYLMSIWLMHIPTIKMAMWMKNLNKIHIFFFFGENKNRKKFTKLNSLYNINAQNLIRLLKQFTTFMQLDNVYMFYRQRVKKKIYIRSYMHGMQVFLHLYFHFVHFIRQKL